MLLPKIVPGQVSSKSWFKPKPMGPKTSTPAKLPCAVPSASTEPEPVLNTSASKNVDKVVIVNAHPTVAENGAVPDNKLGAVATACSNNSGLNSTSSSTSRVLNEGVDMTESKSPSPFKSFGIEFSVRVT